MTIIGAFTKNQSSFSRTLRTLALTLGAGILPAGRENGRLLGSH